MTIWGKRAPSHSICCVVLTKDNSTLVTGSHEGQLCIWDDCDGQLLPRSMLHGHTSKVSLPPSVLPRIELSSKSVNLLISSLLPDCFAENQVACLATELNALTKQQLLVSASESGEMSLWDMNDCRCVEAVKLQQVSRPLCFSPPIRPYLYKKKIIPPLNLHRSTRIFAHIL